LIENADKGAKYLNILTNSRGFKYISQESIGKTQKKEVSATK